jgi:transposase
MRTGRPKAPLALTHAEREALESLAHRSRTRPQLARRARLILLCGDGLASNAVARKLHVRDQTVSKWRGRFVRARLEGLYDEPRPGAPRTIADADIERVLIRTLESTPRGQTHWSLRGMATATGLSRMTISRIWHAFGL